MTSSLRSFQLCTLGGIMVATLAGCQGRSTIPDLEIKASVGSALGHFCEQAASEFNQTNPKLEDGTTFVVSCEAKGSGDVVNQLLELSEQFQSGIITADDEAFPSLVSVDGEIYHNQLVAEMEDRFPGQTYIPAVPDSPLLAFSPMVFMTPRNLEGSLTKTPDLFQALASAKTHKDLDTASPPQPIHYVHTAPTRSNSGLQTLVAQFASVSGKRPEEMTVADIQAHQGKVQQIQSKITRYGISTGSLARDMVSNGPFWASIGSVYESSVIEANSAGNADTYRAVYPSKTFTSNMRGIIPNGPWMSAPETQAAQQFVEYLRSPQTQALAASLGLRPGVPGVPLGNKFSSAFGVQADVAYDSLRPPSPEVVKAMLKSWSEFAKKPSLVAVVIDSSGSMQGTKLAAVQNTLAQYLENLNPQDKIALIDFDSQIREPLVLEGNQAGRDRGLAFISQIRANGGTRLYDASLFARNWIKQNLRPQAINAVLILTDGADEGSQLSFQALSRELESSGFNSDDRIAFFTIGYGAEGSFNADVLQKMAQLNGGYYSKGDPATIEQLMADLQLEF